MNHSPTGLAWRSQHLISLCPSKICSRGAPMSYLTCKPRRRFRFMQEIQAQGAACAASWISAATGAYRAPHPFSEKSKIPHVQHSSTGFVCLPVRLARRGERWVQTSTISFALRVYRHTALCGGRECASGDDQNHLVSRQAVRSQVPGFLAFEPFRGRLLPSEVYSQVPTKWIGR